MARRDARRRWRPIVAMVATSIATSLVAVAGAPSASAGTYDVVACDAAGGVNNSWSVVVNNANAVTAYAACPSGGDATRGMVARNVVVSGGVVAAGAASQMHFSAPAGTAIVGLQTSSEFYRADAHWEAALSTGTQVLLGCGSGGADGCGATNLNQFIGVPNAAQLYIDAYCAYGTCPLDSGDASHNFIEAEARLYSADVRLEDDVPPSIGTPTGGLWSDGWKSGAQNLTFDASDNTGIRSTLVTADGQSAGAHNHACDATLTVPCPQGGDSYAINTKTLADGSHPVTVQATDSAGNTAQLSRTVLVDNSAPASPQNLSVDGGDGWRPANSFSVSWADPPASGAPTTGANWQLCPAGSTSGCQTGGHDADNITALQSLTVPHAGDWTLKVWLHDAAGNQDPATAPAPVHLRFDDQAPSAAFAPIDPADPTRIAVDVADTTSGVASGTISITPHGSQSSTALATKLVGGQLVATLPDETLRRGLYDLQAVATDAAGNERTTIARADGTAAQVTLPVRAATHLTAGRLARHRPRRLAHHLLIAYHARPTLQGQLTDAHHHAIGHTPVAVLTRIARHGTAWHLLRTVTTSRTGRFHFRLVAGPSRFVRLRYEGAPTIRPSQSNVQVSVRASSTMHSSHRTVRNGGAVVFSGGLRSGHVPAGGVLVALQALVNGHWQDFATTHTGAHGRWHHTYRFIGTFRTTIYRFRAQIGPTAGYPFSTGHSTVVPVAVRGN